MRRELYKLIMRLKKVEKIKIKVKYVSLCKNPYSNLTQELS